jgi:hypothetical protein
MGEISLKMSIFGIYKFGLKIFNVKKRGKGRLF